MEPDSSTDLSVEQNQGGNNVPADMRSTAEYRSGPPPEHHGHRSAPASADVGAGLRSAQDMAPRARDGNL